MIQKKKPLWGKRKIKIKIKRIFKNFFLISFKYVLSIIVFNFNTTLMISKLLKSSIKNDDFNLYKGKIKLLCYLYFIRILII